MQTSPVNPRLRLVPREVYRQIAEANNRIEGAYPVTPDDIELRALSSSLFHCVNNGVNYFFRDGRVEAERSDS